VLLRRNHHQSPIDTVLAPGHHRRVGGDQADKAVVDPDPLIAIALAQVIYNSTR